MDPDTSSAAISIVVALRIFLIVFTSYILLILAVLNRPISVASFHGRQRRIKQIPGQAERAFAFLWFFTMLRRVPRNHAIRPEDRE